ncbi:hypothetical protein F8388_025383 [Cannabis sativa]|uniref:Uncharacterized protein n=1 Tax=Cannabis sativa TaxID=3483 RepID=A0A7J6G162_CANSA|nr:hypothetical protein F8388_025383 [Cannabis sativa]
MAFANELHSGFHGVLFSIFFSKQLLLGYGFFSTRLRECSDPCTDEESPSVIAPLEYSNQSTLHSLCWLPCSIGLEKKVRAVNMMTEWKYLCSLDEKDRKLGMQTRVSSQQVIGRSKENPVFIDL